MTFRTIATVALATTVLVLGACAQQVETPESETEHSGSGRQHASSSAGLPSGHPAAGAKVAADKARSATKQSCIDCHGAGGNAPIDPTYPKLAGQYADYLAHALQTYRAGDREHALMTSQAADLSDQQIADLAAYFAAQKGSISDLQSVEMN